MASKYERNLRVIKSKIPYVYEKISSEVDTNSLFIENLDGADNFLIKKDDKRSLANSLVNPDGEMKKYFKGIETNTKTIVITGIGNGYILDYISRHYSYVEQIIVIEPSIVIMKEALHYINLEKVMEKFSLTFILNNNVEKTYELVFEFVQDKLNTNIFIVTQISFASLFSKFHDRLSDLMMRSLRREMIRVSTSYVIPYKRMVNIMTNLKTKSYNGKILETLLSKYPVYIVSAGPSLEKNMHLLVEAKKTGIVIAAGTAIEILDQNGIKPHFRAGFSPHTDTTIFKNLNDDTIPLIYMDTLYHDIIKNYPGMKFKLLSDQDPLTKYALDYEEIDYNMVLTEMSISNIMIEWALSRGSKNIVLVGQDLAYSDMKMYASGSLENRKYSEDNPNLIKEEGNIESVYTDIKFIAMRDSIVNSIARNREFAASVYNATVGGLMIPLTELKDLEDVIDLLGDSDSIDEDIMNIIEMGNDVHEEYDEKIKDFMEHIRANIDEISAIVEERVEFITSVLDDYDEHNSPARVLSKMEVLNKFEEKLKENDLYQNVLQYEFDGIFKSIIASFHYDGTNLLKQKEAVEGIVIRVSLEMRKIVNVFKMLVDEYYGIEYPFGVGNEVIDPKLEAIVSTMVCQEEGRVH